MKRFALSGTVEFHADMTSVAVVVVVAVVVTGVAAVFVVVVMGVAGFVVGAAAAADIVVVLLCFVLRAMVLGIDVVGDQCVIAETEIHALLPRL